MPSNYEKMGAAHFAQVTRRMMGQEVIGDLLQVPLALLLPESEHQHFLADTRRDATIYPAIDTCAVLEIKSNGVTVINLDSLRSQLRNSRLSLAQPCLAFAVRDKEDIRALKIGLPAAHSSRAGRKKGFTPLTKLLLTAPNSVDKTSLDTATTLQTWMIGRPNHSADKSILGIALPDLAATSISKSTYEAICRENRLCRLSRSNQRTEAHAAKKATEAPSEAVAKTVSQAQPTKEVTTSLIPAMLVEPTTTASSNPATQTFHHCLTSQSWPAFTARFAADLPTSQRNAEAETTSILHSVLISGVDAMVAYLVLALEKPEAPGLINLFEETTGLDKLENCVDQFLEACEYSLDVVFDQGATLKAARTLCDIEKSAVAGANVQH